MGFINNKTRATAGYTFIEVIVAIGIFVVIITLTTNIITNFHVAQKREQARNLLIQETQFLLNRITDMVRDNGIDYAEYYSKGMEQEGDPTSFLYGSGEDEDYLYGRTPQEYEWNFFYLDDCDTSNDAFTTPQNCIRENENNFNEGYFNTRADNSQGETLGNDDSSQTALMEQEDASIAGAYLQRELYLVDSNGTTKTILKRLGNGRDDDFDGSIDEDQSTFWKAGNDGNIDGGERLGILEITAESDYYNIRTASGTPVSPDPDDILDFLPGEDFQGDGDMYIEEEDFVPITPSMLKITDLQFLISPLDDPRKAFSETSKDIQIQPRVTILITTEPSDALLRKISGETFSLSLQTSISPRIFSNILFPDP